MPKWLVYSLLTVLFWGVWGMLAKPLGHIAAAQQQAFSTLGILPIMLVLGLSPNMREGQRKRRGSLYALVAGVLVGVGNIAYYHMLAIGTQASIAASATMLYPVATVVLALILLREKPHWLQGLGIAGSLVAIYLLNIGDSTQGDSAWLAYAVVPIVLWGGASILMKLSTRDVSAELATFWFLGAFVPLSATLLLMEAIEWSLSPRDWILVTLLGGTYGIGNLTLLAAYRNNGKASIVTPLSGLYPIVTISLAIAFLKEEIGNQQWVGIAVAVAACVALSCEPKKPGFSEKPGF